MPINEDLFTLNQRGSLKLSARRAPELAGRAVQGVLAALLAHKKQPSAIRYAASSPTCRQVAMDVTAAIASDHIFEFRRHEGPLLLILDRRDDPVTPLLSQWTYQGMVHELLGLNNNRVVLKGAPGIKKDLEEVVLSCTQDDFFAANRHANFGDLGAAVKLMLDKYQSQTKMNENITSIEDMQAFMSRCVLPRAACAVARFTPTLSPPPLSLPGTRPSGRRASTCQSTWR